MLVEGSSRVTLVVLLFLKTLKGLVYTIEGNGIACDMVRRKCGK